LSPQELIATGKANKMKGFEIPKALHLDSTWVGWLE
jgi:hypothetical protein